MSSRAFDRFLAARGPLSSSFSIFRGSLLAALGVAAVACGSGVTTTTGGDTGTAGEGGAGASGGTGAQGGTGGAGASGGSGGAGASGGSGGAGASGGSGGAGASGGSGGAGGGTADCVDPKPILQPNGADTGFVKCADGAINRVSKATCDTTTPPCQGTEMFLGCTSDAQCNSKPGGRCTSLTTIGFGGQQTECNCLYPCAGDADCDGGACACKGVVDDIASFCITPSGCTGPSSCPSGECGLSLYNDGCSTTAELLCREPTDACHGSADCPPEADQCVSSFINPGQFTCAGPGCAIGRPLIAEGTLRFAPAAARADWRAPARDLDVHTDRIPSKVRAALAAYFTEMGAMEHASIGSFARFSLELLALGAPPDLLLLTQQAMADETAHAQLAYALASACSGESVGPGPLPVAGVVPATDPRSIVCALVREACVGETVAAAEALALSQIVDDPALRALWARIAEDEARHAELGWRSLAWMLSGAPPSLRDLAAETFAAAIEGVTTEAPPPPEVTSPEHGLLAPDALAALRRKAVRDIVEPCSRALLAAPPAAATVVATA